MKCLICSSEDVQREASHEVFEKATTSFACPSKCRYAGAVANANTTERQSEK